jgi:carboxypeptidase family protein
MENDVFRGVSGFLNPASGIDAHGGVYSFFRRRKAAHLMPMHGCQELRLLLRASCNLLLFILLTTAVCLFPADASAGEKVTLTGRVRDVAGKPVEGAEIFIYSGAEVRRTADFISSPSDTEGRYSIFLPPGTYWCIARYRKNGARFGPLMPGDKHSGEPMEIEVSRGPVLADFAVADLKEAASLIKKKTREDYVKITGRILERDGKPARGVYVIASTTRSITKIPDYLSPWTDDTGRYTLYLPRGKYYVGVSASFPPDPRTAFTREVLLEENKDDMDIKSPVE